MNTTTQNQKSNGSTKFSSTIVVEEHDPARLEESVAAQLALDGSFAQRAWIAGKALVRLLKNPEDTENVFVLSIALNAKSFPRVLARMLIEPNGLDLLKNKPALDSHTLDFDALLKLPTDTLGYAFAKHMKDNNLSPDVFAAPPGLPPVVAYVSQRIRQSHDIWHVVTGYNTDVPGELALQAFYAGHLQTPSSYLLAISGALKFAGQFRDGKVFKALLTGYRRGAAAKFMPTVEWEKIWAQPLAKVRETLNIEAIA